MRRVSPWRISRPGRGGLVRHPVLDQTGLTGRYDFVLEFTPDLTGAPMPLAPAGADGASEPGTSAASAAERQLGLKLTAGRAMLDVIVVDRAEKTPAAN